MRRRGRERWRKCRLNVKAINLNWVRGGRGRKKLDEKFIGEERDKNAFAFVRFQGDAVRGEISSRLLINYLVFSSRWSCFHAWPHEYYWMLVYTRILTSLTVLGYFSSCFTCTFCISLSELDYSAENSKWVRDSWIPNWHDFKALTCQWELFRHKITEREFKVQKISRSVLSIQGFARALSPLSLSV